MSCHVMSSQSVLEYNVMSVLSAVLFVLHKTTPQDRMTRSCRPWLWVRKYQGEREKAVAVVYCLLWLWCVAWPGVVWCGVVVWSCGASL